MGLDKLDILVNNAGVSQRSQLQDTDFDTLEYIINTNTLGQIYLIKALLPLLKKSKGHIVNISSYTGLVGFTLRTGYSTSKFALAGFSRALRGELTPHDVQVTSVYPGFIRTNISSSAMTGTIGQTMGKTDPIIGNGMPVDEFSEIVLKSVYLGKTEVPVLNTISMHLRTILTPINSFIEGAWADHDFKG